MIIFKLRIQLRISLCYYKFLNRLDKIDLESSILLIPWLLSVVYPVYFCFLIEDCTHLMAVISKLIIF